MGQVEEVRNVGIAVVLVAVTLELGIPVSASQESGDSILPACFQVIQVGFDEPGNLYHMIATRETPRLEPDTQRFEYAVHFPALSGRSDHVDNATGYFKCHDEIPSFLRCYFVATNVEEFAACMKASFA